MSSQKPKISFNAGPAPRVAPVVQQAEKEFIVQAETVTETAQSVTYDGFDREAWERELDAPKPATSPAAQAAPKSYEPFTPTPKAVGFSPIGFFKKPQPRFLERHMASGGTAAVMLGVVAIGAVAVLSIRGDDASGAERATFSAPLQAAAGPEETTRAAIADMTMTALPSDLSVGTALPPLNDAVMPVSAPAPEVSAAENANSALDILGANKLRMLRESILAGLYDVETYEQAGAQRIRLSTPNAQFDSQTSANLMLEAVARDDMNVSNALYTTTGAVDVETMMFNLVQASLFGDPGASAQEAALDMSRKIFAASPVRSQTVSGLRYYAVQEGDSLAYIALQFYGRPAAFQRILEANPDILQSPDKIQTGQLLHVPR